MVFWFERHHLHLAVVDTVLVVAVVVLISLP